MIYSLCAHSDGITTKPKRGQAVGLKKMAKADLSAELCGWVNRLQKAAQAQKLPAADEKGTPTIAEIVDALLPLAKQKLLKFEAKGELYPERLRRPKPVDPIPTFVESDSKRYRSS
jgi:hypothetical protein